MASSTSSCTIKEVRNNCDTASICSCFYSKYSIVFFVCVSGAEVFNISKVAAILSYEALVCPAHEYITFHFWICFWFGDSSTFFQSNICGLVNSGIPFYGIGDCWNNLLEVSYEVNVCFYSEGVCCLGRNGIFTSCPVNELIALISSSCQSNLCAVLVCTSTFYCTILSGSGNGVAVKLEVSNEFNVCFYGEGVFSCLSDNFFALSPVNEYIMLCWSSGEGNNITVGIFASASYSTILRSNGNFVLVISNLCQTHTLTIATFLAPNSTITDGVLVVAQSQNIMEITYLALSVNGASPIVAVDIGVILMTIESTIEVLWVGLLYLIIVDHVAITTCTTTCCRQEDSTSLLKFSPLLEGVVIDIYLEVFIHFGFHYNILWHYPTIREEQDTKDGIHFSCLLEGSSILTCIEQVAPLFS